MSSVTRARRRGRTAQENQADHDAGSARTYAVKLQGRLMLFFGTADSDVHPNDSLQPVAALQKPGKSFAVQVGPDMGHSAVSTGRRMEFLLENLVLKRGDS